MRISDWSSDVFSSDLTPPRGYDRTAVLPGHEQYFDSPMIVDGVHTIAHGHVDDAIGDQALRFLRGRPHDRPFALLYQFKAPHGNWPPAPRFPKAFEDMEMPEPPTPYEDRAGRPRPVPKAHLPIAGQGDRK